MTPSTAAMSRLYSTSVSTQRSFRSRSGEDDFRKGHRQDACCTRKRKRERMMVITLRRREELRRWRRHHPHVPGQQPPRAVY